MAARITARAKLDQYPTPAWAVVRLLEHQRFPAPFHGRWAEPCAGEGALIRAVNYFCDREKSERPRWTANEIDLDLRPRLMVSVITGEIFCGDVRAWATSFQQCAPGEVRPFNVIITNPPYNIAEEVFRAVRPLARWTVLLLRIAWLSSAERRDMIAKDEPDVFVLPNRPSFSANGQTDMHDYAWFVWGPKRKRVGRVHHLALTPKEVRRGSK